MAPVDAPLAAMAPRSCLSIEVVVGWGPRDVQQWQLSVPLACTLQQALELSGALAVRPDELSLATLASGAWSVGVWGRREKASHVLRDQDRIEVVRGLIVDPKEARRVRYTAHGGRAAAQAKRKLLQKKGG